MKLAKPLQLGDLVLKTLDATHADGPYLDWFIDPEVTKFLEPISGAMTAEHLRAYILDNNQDQTSLLAGLFVDDGGRHVGNVRLSGLDRGYSRCSIGIVIGARDCWGLGFASAAISALTDVAHADLGVDYLYAGCHKLNHGSVRAFLKAGYIDFSSASDTIRNIAALRCAHIDHVKMVHCRG